MNDGKVCWIALDFMPPTSHSIRTITLLHQLSASYFETPIKTVNVENWIETVGELQLKYESFGHLYTILRYTVVIKEKLVTLLALSVNRQFGDNGFGN
jgi:hypothetical protein